MKSIKNGDWFDSSCWDAGRVPTPIDVIKLEHYMTSRRSVIIENELYSRRGGIWFIGIDENNFVGGGHSPYEISKVSGLPLHVTDIGLWVWGNGYLDMQGTPKTGWTTISENVLLGATKTKLPVSGWKVGDQIAFAPNEVDAYQFSETTIRNINGADFTFDAVGPGHAGTLNPQTGKTHYTQVINLTRGEVYIKGSPTGRAHILISSNKPQTVNYILLQHMGPRREQSGDDRTELVKGRYALHFHHATEGSRGSQIKGNVAIDCGNHCYVPHGSNGIYFFDNIAYRVLETPYWWDLGHSSTDVTYDHNFGGDISYINRSKLMDQQDPLDPNIDNVPPTFFVNGMELGIGPDDRVTAINNCFAGMNYGDSTSGAAYSWQANNEGVWKFFGNIAHNCYCAIFIWQNTRFHHALDDTTVYNALASGDKGERRILIFNGAYGNPFRHRRCVAFNGLVIAKAASQFYDVGRDKYGQVWEECTFDEFQMFPSPLPGEQPILLRNSKVGKIKILSGIASDTGLPMPHNLDVVNCNSMPITFEPEAGDLETVRVQNASEIYMMTKNGGKVPIAKFNFDVVTPVEFLSVAFTKAFTRNNCMAPLVGSVVNITVAKGQFKSSISQSDADLQANNWAQNEANTKGTCTPVVTTIFKNVQRGGVFTRNNCPAGSTPGTFSYIVPAGKYTSTEGQADANAKADAEVAANAQNEANLKATCTPIATIFKSVAKSKDFTRNNCPQGSIGSIYTYKIAAGVYTSSVSQAAADKLADDDINAKGQIEANTKGTCTPIMPTVEEFEITFKSGKKATYQAVGKYLELKP